MNFLKNLPGGRAGEANRSDPQSGVSRLIPVNVPEPMPAPEIPAPRVSVCRPGLRGQLPAARASEAHARNPGLPTDIARARMRSERSGTGTGTGTFTGADEERVDGAPPLGLSSNGTTRR